MSQHSRQLFVQMKGQYILTAEGTTAPEGWSVTAYGEWKLFTNSLPVIDVYDEKNKWIGWCLGHPVIGGILEPDKVVLKKSTNAFDPYEEFYDRTTGKWILVLVGDGNMLYLDPHGSLPAVFSEVERTIASTPTLIGSDDDWDEQLMADLGYPEKINWIPSGLTFKKNVRRLIANHCLNLTNLSVKRHWPTPTTDFTVDNDTESSVRIITNNIQSTIIAAAKKYPLCLTLTAGMDSRNVLACARNIVKEAKIITFIGESENQDTVIARRLAKKLNLNHEFLPILKGNAEEMARWQYITGRSVAGGIWKIHKTLSQLEPDRVLMSGQSGEVHRGNYWRPGDTANKRITAVELLKRCKFPPHPLLLKATEEWLSEMEYLNTFNILDLVHIEQRMSCWGAIQAFGNLTSAFEISPLGSRTVFQCMMRLPHNYRKKQQLAYDIARSLWPELLQEPFNSYPGVYGYFRSRAKKLIKMYKRMVE